MYLTCEIFTPHRSTLGSTNQPINQSKHKHSKPYHFIFYRYFMFQYNITEIVDIFLLVRGNNNIHIYAQVLNLSFPIFTTVTVFNIQSIFIARVRDGPFYYCWCIKDFAILLHLLLQLCCSWILQSTATTTTTGWVGRCVVLLSKATTKMTRYFITTSNK